jgi:hypothetical protein
LIGRKIIKSQKSNEVLTEAICPACDAGHARKGDTPPVQMIKLTREREIPP